jgi:hypothetical protein
MAASKLTAQKRAKEKARQERQRAKQQRRLETKERKANAAGPSGGEDPDIAGIVPGPQPRPEWLEGFDDESESETEDTNP